MVHRCYCSADAAVLRGLVQCCWSVRCTRTTCSLRRRAVTRVCSASSVTSSSLVALARRCLPPARLSHRLSSTTASTVVEWSVSAATSRTTTLWSRSTRCITSELHLSSSNRLHLLHCHVSDLLSRCENRTVDCRDNDPMYIHRLKKSTFDFLS